MANTSEVIVVAVRDNSILVHNRNPLYALLSVKQAKNLGRKQSMKADRVREWEPQLLMAYINSEPTKIIGGRNLTDS
jgi:hypothetical protein